MAAFNYEWDDFRGGLYIGPSDVNQPKNTWKGYNVTLSDDDATLVPTYTPTTLTLTGTDVSTGVIDLSTSNTSWSPATYFNGYIYIVGVNSSNAKLYSINTSTGAVTATTAGDIPHSGSTVSNSPPVAVINSSGTTDIYVAVNQVGYIYKVNGTTVTSISVTPATSTKITNITLWNARLIVWGNATDTFYFSEALNFGTFLTLNYVGVGYSNDGISYCIPRNLDLVVVKPSGWYSITGVLGANTAVRQLNDTLGILADDPIAQHNSVVFFNTPTGNANYAINLLAISGTRIDVAAYQRFGTDAANITLSRSNLGYMTVAAVYNDPSDGLQYAYVYLLNPQDRWQLVKFNGVISSPQNYKFNVAQGQVSRYNNAQDQTLYLIETSNGSTTNKLAVHKIRPNTIEPGKSTTNAPSSAVLKLSDIATKTPVMIRRVFVEAEMMQIPDSPYTGNASIQAKVNSKAVGDISFNENKESTSGLSTAYTFAYSSFTAVTNAIYSQTRVMRFDVNNAAYGYTNEIEIQFSGLRIRRIWVEGDSR